MFETIKHDKKVRERSPFIDLIAPTQIYGGIHRFCLRISGLKAGNTFSKFKYGVSKVLSQQKKFKCFSDFDTGYSFYSIGQTRNGSDSSGLPYIPGLNNIGNYIALLFYFLLMIQIRFWIKPVILSI